jgi:hypothetical protein
MLIKIKIILLNIQVYFLFEVFANFKKEFLMATLNREDFMTDERLEMVFNIIDKVKNIILYIILNKKYT